VKHITPKTFAAGIVLTVSAGMTVSCASIRERGSDIPSWCSENLLESVGVQTWTVLAKSRHIYGFRGNIWDSYIMDHGLSGRLKQGIPNGETDRLVLESENLMAVVWFMFPNDRGPGCVEYENYCYNKKTGDTEHHSYGMCKIDRPSRREIDRNLRLMKNIPSWYAESLWTNTRESQWRAVASPEKEEIERKTRKIFIDNEMWPEDMEKAEQENKLNILVLKSRSLTTVLWYYFRCDPIKSVVFKDFCFKEGYDDVLFGGGGEVGLEEEQR
jgi:hypothetical protein